MSGTVTGLDLTRLEELAEKATPGPWAIDETPGFEYHVRTGGTTCAIPSTGEPVADTALDADAEFIAAMRNAVPSLLAAARAVQAVRELHAPMNRPNHSSVLCHECVVLWPCATVAALGTEQEGRDE